MEIKYTGPYEEVDIPSAGVTVKRGEKVEVPDDIGKSLLDQDTFEAVKKGAK